ncbi:MAG TPA: tetratricopeptide repeat protein [Terriglobia bacterium]|nr:tetratricopeptide repeat protein [Terriglobia bacterium]
MAGVVDPSDALEMRLISNLQGARDRKLIVCSWDLTNKLAWFYLSITDFPDRWRVYEEEVIYAERTLGPTDPLTLEIHTAVGGAYVDLDPDKALRHLQSAAAVSPLPYQLSMNLSTQFTMLENRLTAERPEKAEMEVAVFQKQLEVLQKVDFSPYPMQRANLEICLRNYAALLRRIGRNAEAENLDQQLKTLPPLRSQPNNRATVTTNPAVNTPPKPAAPAPVPSPLPVQSVTIPPEGQCPQALARDLARMSTQESDLQSLLEKTRAQKLVACSWDITQALGSYYLTSKKPAASEKVFEDEVRFAENSLGREHLQVLRMRLDLAKAYTLFYGNYERAQQHLEALAKSSAVPQPMAFEVANAMDTLGALYADPSVRNQPQRALTVYEETVALWDKLGAAKDESNRLSLELTLERYEDVLRKAGRSSDAARVHTRLQALDPGWYFDVPNSPKDIEAERAAIANISRIEYAEMEYRVVHGKFGTVPELTADGKLDKAFEGLVLGYRFTVTLSPNSRQFSVLAKPEGAVGRYSFKPSENGATVFAGGPPGTPVGEVPPKILWNLR